MKRGMLVLVAFTLFLLPSTYAICQNVSNISMNFSAIEVSYFPTSCYNGFSTTINVESYSAAFENSYVGNSSAFDSTIESSSLDNVELWHASITNTNVNCTLTRLNITGVVENNQLVSGVVQAGGAFYYAPLDITTVCTTPPPISASLTATPAIFHNNTGVVFTLFSSGQTDLTVLLNVSEAQETERIITMNDSGVWPDAIAGDGIFTAVETLQVLTEGAVTARASIQDNVGNDQEFTTPITGDLTPPNGTLSINGGEASTGTRSVQLSMVGNDANGVVGCRYGNRNLTGVIACAFDSINCYPFDLERTDNVGLTTGQSGFALREHTQTGDGNYTIRSSGSSLNYSNGTLSFWVRHEEYNASTAHPYVTVHTMPGYNLSLFINRSTTHLAYISQWANGGTNSTLDTEATVLSDGQWHHVALTWAMNDSRLTFAWYIDGDLNASNTTIWENISDTQVQVILHPHNVDGNKVLFDNVILEPYAMNVFEVNNLFHTPQYLTFTPCGANDPWLLTQEIDENKTVYAQVLDGGGNIKTVFSSIFYTGSLEVDDTTAPTNVSVSDEGHYTNKVGTFQFYFSALDPESKVLFRRRLRNASATLDDWALTSGFGISSSALFQHINVSHGEHYGLEVEAFNEANLSVKGPSDGIIVDLVPPHSYNFTVVPDTNWSTTRNISIFLEEEDNISGVAGISYLASSAQADADLIPDITEFNSSNVSRYDLRSLEAGGGGTFIRNSSHVALDGFGNVYFASHVTSGDGDTHVDKFTIGDFRHVANYTISLSDPTTSAEEPQSVAANADGTVFVGTYRVKSWPNHEMQYFAWNADGTFNTVWNITSADVNQSKILVDEQGGVYFLEGYVTAGATYLRTYKYSSAGSLQWTAIFQDGSNEVFLHDGMVHKDGNLYSLVHSTNGSCYLVSQETTAGTQQWNRTLPLGTQCAGGSLTQDTDGRILITGPAYANITMFAYDTGGEFINSFTSPSGPAGSLAVVGDEYHFIGANSNLTIVTNRTGSVLHNYSLPALFFSAPTEDYLFGKGVADSRGNVYAVSYSRDGVDIRYTPVVHLRDPVQKKNATIDLTSLADGTYRFTHRAVDTVGNWQDVSNLTLRMDATAPSTPQIFSGSEFSSNPFTIYWSESKDFVSGVRWYHVRIDDNANFTSPVFEDNVGNVTEYSYTAPANGTYYATVLAENGAGLNSSWSPTSGVAFDQSPPVVTVVSPSEGDTLVTNTPTFHILTDEVASCSLINDNGAVAITEPFDFTHGKQHTTIPSPTFLDPAHTRIQFVCYDLLNNSPVAGHQVQLNFTINTALTADFVLLSAAPTYYLGSFVNISTEVRSGGGAGTLLSGLSSDLFTATTPFGTIDVVVSERGAGIYDLYMQSFDEKGTQEVTISVEAGTDSAVFSMAQSNLSIIYSGEVPSALQDTEYMVYGSNDTFSMGAASDSPSEDLDINFVASGYDMHGTSQSSGYLFATGGNKANILAEKEKYLEGGDFLDQTLPTFGLPSDPELYTIALVLSYSDTYFEGDLTENKGRVTSVIKHEGFVSGGDNDGKINMSVVIH